MCRPYPQAARFSGYDSACCQQFAMAGKYEFTRRSLPQDGTVHEPDDTAVRLAMDDSEFAEVLVERHEDALLVASPRENRGVTWIGRPGTGPDDVMPRASKDRRGLSGETCVEK